MTRDYRKHMAELSNRMEGQKVERAFPQYLIEIILILEDIDKRLCKMEDKKLRKKTNKQAGLESFKPKIVN